MACKYDIVEKLFLKIIVFRLFLKFLKTNSVKKNILAIFSLRLLVSHHRLLKSLNVFILFTLFQIIIPMFIFEWFSTRHKTHSNIWIPSMHEKSQIDL